jgi:MEMO1 family protein
MVESQGKSMYKSIDVRPSPIAGQWYEGDPTRLASKIDQYITKAVLPDIQGEVIAVISPHAGHIYSGSVAGYAFAAIRDLQPEVVAVISPMHQPYRDSFLTTAHSAYWTPLGEIPVDSEILVDIDSYLTCHDSPGLSPIKKDQEHSLEIELPFLQRIYSHPFHLVPIMVREQSPLSSEILGQALFSSLKGKKAVVVASTDLSHFYSQQTANQLDKRMLDAMQKLSPRGMFDLEAREEGFACGLGAVAAVIHYALLAGADQGIILKHATSGDVTGDNSSVVGYGALAIIRKSV